jgi:hypothetical protein
MNTFGQRRVMRSAINELRADIGARTGILIDRYDAMYVLPIRLQVEWLSIAWPLRLWLWLRGRKPDAAAIQEARLQELLDKVDPGCGAEKDGSRCELTAGHDGPHQRSSAMAASGVVEWDQEPAA